MLFDKTSIMARILLIHHLNLFNYYILKYLSLLGYKIYYIRVSSKYKTYLNNKLINNNIYPINFGNNEKIDLAYTYDKYRILECIYKDFMADEIKKEIIEDYGKITTDQINALLYSQINSLCDDCWKIDIRFYKSFFL